MADPRGYRPVVVQHGSTWMISSGCRWFDLQKALAHWSDPAHNCPKTAAKYVRAIEAIPRYIPTVPHTSPPDHGYL
jgi:hypothetical protein